MTKWYHHEIMPFMAGDWGSEELECWAQFYPFLKQFDPAITQCYFNMSAVDVSRYPINTGTRYVFFCTFGETPRYTTILELARQHPEATFIWLADINMHDAPVPDNLKCFKYRQWIIWLQYLLETVDVATIPLAKSKNIYKKFSSMAFFRRQSRAVITAALMTYARDQSILSWHSMNNSTNARYDHTQDDMHEYLIKTIISHTEFQDLDWAWLDTVMEFDQYGMGGNLEHLNILDVHNPAYQTALINFNNETDALGWLNDGNIAYNRPGPFLSEKSWKSLISGTILLSNGQPGTYEFLKNDYCMPIDYSMDLSYDQDAGDFTRLKKIVELIQSLSNTPLSDLIDANIDNCELIQKTILNYDYVDMIRAYNLEQDQKILALLG
jgi:hypothetical protein